ncbi:MAG: DNA repair protein RecO [Eubacteriales bacterium]|nr:DNA repair protein RecO [Eubacteriales bacterium]
MTHLTKRAFVLRVVPYGENRRLLDLLSQEGEIITLSCHKGRKMGPANFLSQAFVLADFELFYYKSRYSLDGGHLVYPFSGLQEDFDRITALSHLAELYLDALKSQAALPEAYKLWAYTASRLEHATQPLLDVRISQFKFLCLLGFMPWLFDCLTCHRPYEAGMQFNFQLSGLECSHRPLHSATSPEFCLPMSPGLLASLRYIVQADLAQLFNFQISPAVQDDLITFSDRYLTHTMEKSYQRLRLSDEMTAFSRALQETRQNPSPDLPEGKG